ncbi:MAG: dockerin type I domain-containing protein [Planctomycetota bacterium]
MSPKNRCEQLYCLLPIFLFVVWLVAPAWAQFPSELVGFNGPPIDDPDTAREMFRQPPISGSTDDYIVPNSPDVYDFNAAFRASGQQTEGAAAMEVFWNWVDTNDPDAWLRLTTSDGPDRPNPALHTNGQVRFKIVNRSEIFDGEIGICLGIRETGVVVPQLYDGGIDGTIEWVGVDTTPNGIIAGPNWIVDTQAIGDDEQVYPMGTDIGPDGLDLPSGTAVVAVGPNGTLETAPVSDDQVRFGYFLTASGERRPIPAITLAVSEIPKLLEWDIATGNVTVDGTPMGGGNAGFTGNGVIDVVPTRGTLEQIAFTNLTTDPAVLIHVAIDELQFEAPDPDPVMSPSIVRPILLDQTAVTVTDLQNGVDEVTLYVNGGFLDSQTTTSMDDVTFTIAPAVPGDIYTATQTIDSVEGPPSDPVVVTFTEQAPTIYMAPAENTDTVTVIGLDPGTTLVEINLNGTPTFSAIPAPGSDRVDVPVAGLLVGDRITAVMWVGTAPSVESDYETVTVSTRTSVIDDDFESYADQAAMEAVWTQAGAGTVLLDVTMDATGPPNGAQSTQVPDDPDPDVPPPAYMTRVLELGGEFIVPTETEPVVWNVDIYDPVGPDPDRTVVEWVELNHYGGPDWFLVHIGAFDSITDPNTYDFRATGNGGPNWVDLNEFDAPLREVGWHNFTMVHKGLRIDVYVDGKLARKNIQLEAETTYARADVGGGYNGDVSIWVDDFIVDVGAVWFNVPTLGYLIGDMNCDGNINAYDIDGFICALSPQCDYEAMYPDCNRQSADCNGDGDVNAYDIDTFILLVGGGG